MDDPLASSSPPWRELERLGRRKGLGETGHERRRVKVVKDQSIPAAISALTDGACAPFRQRRERRPEFDGVRSSNEEKPGCLQGHGHAS